MTEVPSNLRYTKDHEWLLVEGNTVTMGITDHAQKALGDLVYVELPEVGSEVARGDSFAVVESVKAASEVYAPVSGTVVAVNEALADDPSQVNNSPYEGGWIAKIEIADKAELDDTLSDDDYMAEIDQ